MRKRETYRPHAKTARILDRAFELVESVPYSVSLRWVFYRLLQEGFYRTKDDYKNKCEPAISAARRAFYKGWRPDTLADETREAIVRGNGYRTPEDWLVTLSERVTCPLCKWHDQSYYVELWYEARAMSDQFRYYTDHITLVPMGGQPSIPYKWKIAKTLEKAAQAYGVPIVVLYFGDLDPAGHTIADTVRDDVAMWCDEPFEFVHCGLTPDQVALYGVPENFEKPGEYQWEALTDAAASEIITVHVAQFVDAGALAQVEAQEAEATDWTRQRLKTLAAEWRN